VALGRKEKIKPAPTKKKKRGKKGEGGEKFSSILFMTRTGRERGGKELFAQEKRRSAPKILRKKKGEKKGGKQTHSIEKERSFGKGGKGKRGRLLLFCNSQEEVERKKKRKPVTFSIARTKEEKKKYSRKERAIRIV